jgi:Xaa-Pro aminopeptidase
MASAVPDTYRFRLGRLREDLKQRGLDALLVSKPVHIRYLSGFRGDDSLLLVTSGSLVLVSDFRFKEEIEKDHPWAALVIRRDREDVFALIGRLAARKAVRRLGFEARHASYFFYNKLRRSLGRARKLIPSERLIEGLRIIKSPEEVRLIREAAQITDRTLEYLIPRLKRGSEEGALRNLAEFEMRRLGAEGPGFDPIIAVGQKTSQPHALTGRKRLKNGMILLIDMGSRVKGYHSDLTRTFFAGSISARFRRLYRAVLDAQEAALASIRPGVKLAEVDRAARRVLKRGGLDRYFGHATGHGVGLEVHEAPRIAPNSRESARENMIFTVEPGVYLPGWGGIRIEDTVRVTKTGCEVITGFTKDKPKVMLKS